MKPRLWEAGSGKMSVLRRFRKLKHVKGTFRTYDIDRIDALHFGFLYFCMLPLSPRCLFNPF